MVLFSLGFTGFSSKDFPAETTVEFLKAFSKLSQRVIMRFDPEFLPFVPENVMVAKWVPQQSILGNQIYFHNSQCGSQSMSLYF